MPTFFYTAKSQANEEKTGTYEAANKSELAHFLRQQGFFLTSTKILGQKETAKIKLNFRLLNFFQPITLVDKMLFTRHLAVMIKAGLPLNQALDVLAKQAKNKKLAGIIEDLNSNIQKGMPFSDSLAKYPKVFSGLFVNMIKIGESGGNLEEILKLLAIQMDKDHQLISKVIGAMIYPAIIVASMIGTGIIMMIWVVPKLVATFEELRISLPTSTKFLIGLSDFLVKYVFISILLLIVLIIFLIQILKTKQGKRSLDWLILHAPVLGGIIQKINSARLMRALGSLIEGGVPIVKSLQVVSETLTNAYYFESLVSSAKEIQKGQSLSKILKKYPSLYPLLITQMVEVGEKTGTLSNVLKELADFYEEEVDNFTKNLATIIEPILMVIIGAAIGFFAISMIQPIYTMMGGL